MKTEVRASKAAGTEVRMIPGEDGKPSMIEGYAALYDSPSQDLGGFIEVVKPGAFSQALADGCDVRAKYNHEAILARTKSGTLRLFDDAKGLRYQFDIPDTTVGRDLMVSLKRGDVDGSSFAFRVMPDGEAWRREGGMPLRELRSLDLRDISVVDEPAYLGTEGNVGLRSLPDSSQQAAAALETQAPTGTPNRHHARVRLAESEG